MNATLKNVLAVLLGIVVGSVVNGALVNVGHKIFPIEGLDPDNMEQLAEVMPTLSYEYFIFPFLAHAVGTFVAAFLAMKVGKWETKFVPIFFGFLFLAGGIAVAFMIPAPVWFLVLDLGVAYLPMAFLGYRLGK